MLPNQKCSQTSIVNAIKHLYTKLVTDAIIKIKNNLKSSSHCPYLWVSVQNATSLWGLYSTGADISCLSEKVLHQLPPHYRPKKLSGESTPKFKLARGQPLPVRNCYKFKTRIGTKFLKQEFYVIPDLNEPLNLGIDFIQKHQLWYCPKKFLCLGGEG